MSAAWMAGYVSDIAYTLGFYRELAPSFLHYVCIASGVESISGAPRLRYCELGCGRGYGTALLAAANPDIDFIGIDFNPTHIAEARALAMRCGLPNVEFIETSFGEAVTSRHISIRDFDIVVLHGVYTWVDASIRRDIISFLRSKLVSGGIAYISYNTQPGWAAVAPLQHILKQYADRATGDSLVRLAKGRDMLQQLAAKNSAYVGQNQVVRSRIDNMATQDVHYLAHEFLNAHWSPIYVTEAFSDFNEAKLTYVGSANIGENRLPFCVSRDMIDLVDAAPDLALREQIKDYAVNKQFRRDVYVKGPIRLTGAQQRQRFDDIPFVLASGLEQIPEIWKIPAGEARPKHDLVNAIAQRLMRGVATGKELREAVGQEGFGESELQPVLEIMIHNYYVAPCRLDAGKHDRAAADRLNGLICELALSEDSHRFLAAPTTGSAVGSNFFERIALPVILANSEADVRTTAEMILQRMESAGKKMTREGKLVGHDDLSELAKLVAEMRKSALPRWKDLGVVARQ